MEDFSGNFESLQDLGVDLVQQEDLEKDLNLKLNRSIAQKEDDLDKKRLEKAQKRLGLLEGKLRLYQRRIQNPHTKISEKQHMQRQIKSLEAKDIAQTKAEIDEITRRVTGRKDDIHKIEDLRNHSNSDQVQEGGKLPSETEKEYLIRTGKITAFGHTSNFHFNSDLETVHSETVTDEPVIVDNEHDDINQRELIDFQREDKDYDDDEYIDENQSEEKSENEFLPELENENKSAANKESIDDELQQKDDEIERELNTDDGNGQLFKKRFDRWLQTEESIRESRGLTNSTNEKLWYLPNPDFPDAILNDQFRVPGQLFQKLFNYQKTCVQWLYELYSQKVGGIIGDEMGLGKTVQMIAFLSGLQYSKRIQKPILIVCPSTVMRQWVKEFHKWYPPFRVSILHSIGSGMQNSKDNEFKDLYEMIEDYDENHEVKKSLSTKKMQEMAFNLIESVFNSQDPGRQVIVTTFAGIKIYSRFLLKKFWGYAVLDEGHKIRNPNAEVSLCAKRIRTRHRIILSGTPIQNNLTELWSLFDFIYPGKLGTLPVFQQEFVIPINMGGYANASNFQVQASLKCAVALKNLISPYLLRRLKVDVAKDLPKKTEMVLFCKMTKYQQEKYLDFIKSSDAESILSGRKNALYGIDILKKICNHPDLLLLNEKYFKGETSKLPLEDDEDINDGGSFNAVTKKVFGNPLYSGKMQVLKTLITSWKSGGHKILLFTQTKQMLNILETFLQRFGDINYLRMDGSTPIKVRQDLMDSFNNNPEIHIFLLTTRVGGLGVNLVGADRVIIFDPDWNPSTDIQARERAWRLGQKKDVTIYRLMTKGTIEEKIYQRQIFKQFLSNKVLKDPNQRRVFKMNELNDLFTYGNDDVDEEREFKKQKENNSDDFLEVTKINGVAGLEDYNTGEGSSEVPADVSNVSDVKSRNTGGKRKKTPRDEDRILGGILEGSGVSIKPDDVETSDLTKKAGDEFIDKEAQRIANDAVSSLRKSKQTISKTNKIGVPTWTGKFGKNGRISKVSNINKGFSSSSIIEKLKMMPKSNDDTTNINNDIPMTTPEVSKLFTSSVLENKETILQNIKNFLVEQPENFGRSQNIMKSLNISLSNESDIKLIRSLLREIANWDKEKSGWTLKENFKDL